MRSTFTFFTFQNRKACFNVWYRSVFVLLNSNRSICKSTEKTLRDIYVDSPLEKKNIHMYKYVLGVGRRISNGELGRYPLYIDIVLAIIKYRLCIIKDSETDTLVMDALQDDNDIFQTRKNVG